MFESIGGAYARVYPITWIYNSIIIAVPTPSLVTLLSLLRDKAL